MNLTTAITTLHVAGLSVTATSPTHWKMQRTSGPNPAFSTVTDDELVAFVAQARPSPVDPPRTQPSLAQAVALLRAAGMQVEPANGSYWEVTVAPRTRRAFEHHHSPTSLIALAHRVMQHALTVRQHMPGDDTQTPTHAPLDAPAILTSLAHLGMPTTAQLADLHQTSVEAAAQVVAGLQAKAWVTAGQWGTWLLTPQGWPQAATLVDLDHLWPQGQPTWHEDLGLAVSQICTELHAIQFGQMDVRYGHPMFRTMARLTLVPQAGPIAWRQNLAAHAAAAGQPSHTVLVVVLEADQATSTALPGALARLREEAQAAQAFLCLITASPGLADVVAGALARHLPHDPWAVTSSEHVAASHWHTNASGHMALDCAMAFGAEPPR